MKGVYLCGSDLCMTFTVHRLLPSVTKPSGKSDDDWCRSIFTSKMSGSSFDFVTS